MTLAMARPNLLVKIIFLAWLTIVNVADGAREQGESSASAASSAKCLEIIEQVHERFLEDTPDPESSESLSLLEEAMDCYDSLANADRDKCRDEILEIGDLHYVMTNTECIEDSLSYRYWIWDYFFVTYPKLAKFVLHHNSKQLKQCQNEIETGINQHIGQVERDLRQDRLKQLLQAIKSTSSSSFRESDFRQNVVAGFNRYLRATGFNMNIPNNGPLDQHLQGVVQEELNQAIVRDCDPLLGALEKPLIDGQLLQTTADKMEIKLDWGEKIRQIMQLTSICNIISEMSLDLYLLGSYNFVMRSNELHNDDEVLPLARVADILSEFILYYMARQRVFDEDHNRHIADLNNLLAIRNTRTMNCDFPTLRIINHHYEQNRDYPSLTRYIDHHGLQLFLRCVPKFERSMMQKLRNYPGSFKARIMAIFDNIKSIMARSGQRLTNRTVISRSVFQQAFSEFLVANQIPVIDNRQIAERHAHLVEDIGGPLIGIPCSDLLNELGEDFILYMDEIARLDRTDPSPFTNDAQEWIALINICRAIRGH